MERTVPSTASEEIELYQRTYYSLLRSSAEVQIRTLEEAHAQMNSLLHPQARETTPDLSAFVYSILRLPPVMPHVKLVVLGQSPEVFIRRGYGNVENWQQVIAPGRRRRCFFDGKEIMACYIASRTDIDDVIPLLTAYQIEWNKFHALLQMVPDSISLSGIDQDPEIFDQIADALKISVDDLNQLRTLLGADFSHVLQEIASRKCRFRVDLLSGSLSDYWRATRIWWDNIHDDCPKLDERPVYFISSNTHSMVNIVSGYVLGQKNRLLEYIDQSGNGDLLSNEWEKIKDQKVPSNRENFFYYAFKKFQTTPEGQKLKGSKTEHEISMGIQRIPSLHSFDVEAQVIELSRLRSDYVDPRLGQDLAFLAESDALILNIDYPLGMAAYNILSKVSEQVGEVLGVYVTGKAATLNGVIGDVMIPTVVHDEQSGNTYLFPNSFTAADVSPYVVYGATLDNQKAVTVRGTFLQR